MYSPLASPQQKGDRSESPPSPSQISHLSGMTNFQVPIPNYFYPSLDNSMRFTLPTQPVNHEFNRINSFNQQGPVDGNYQQLPLGNGTPQNIGMNHQQFHNFTTRYDYSHASEPNQISGNRNPNSFHQTVQQDGQLRNQRTRQQATQQKPVNIESVPEYISNERYFDSSSYSPGDKFKAVPLLLFTDYVYDSSTNQVIQLDGSCGYVNPHTGYPDINSRNPNLLYIVRESVQVIRKLASQLGNIPVSIVSIVGPMRLGKSLLSGLLIGDKTLTAFDLGHEVVSKTKGVWMSCQLVQGQNSYMLVLDSEGMNSTDASNDRDYLILLLTVLISSYFIYNSQSCPKRSDLHHLSFISKIAESLTFENGAYSPYFHWIMRDVFLQIPKGYDLQSYMEECVLQSNNDKLDDIVGAIVKYFPKRKFDTVPIPHPSGAVLCDMVRNWNLLYPDFVYKIQEIVYRITQNAQPKYFHNLEGAKFKLELNHLPLILSNYVIKLNTPGMVPSFSDPVSLISETSLRKGKQQIIEQYYQMMNEAIQELPIEHDLLLDIHRNIIVDLGKKFSDICVFTNDQIVKKEFDQLIQLFMQTDKSGNIIGGSIYDFHMKNIEASRKLCQSIITKLYNEALALFERDIETKTMEDIEKLFDEIGKLYNEQAKGPSKAHTLQTFFEERVNTDKHKLKLIKSYREDIIQERLHSQRIQDEQEKLKQQLETIQQSKQAEKELYEETIKKTQEFQEEMLKTAQEDKKRMQELQEKFLIEQRELYESTTHMIAKQQQQSEERMNQMMTVLQQQAGESSRQIGQLSNVLANANNRGSSCNIL